MLATSRDTQALLRHLERRLYRGLSARAGEGAALVSITLGLPSGMETGIPRPDPEGVYWARPASQGLRVAAGRAWRATATGVRRFERLDSAWERLARGWLRLDPEGLDREPWAFLGFAFDPDEPCGGEWSGLPNAILSVPEVLLSRSGGRWGLTLSTPGSETRDVESVVRGWLGRVERLFIGPAGPLSEPVAGAASRPVRVTADPPEARWLAGVAAARRAIRGSGPDKLVLTRRVRVRARRPLAVDGLLAWLAAHYPGCAQFAVAAGEGLFVGASPERLLSLEGTRLVTDALAGTAACSGDHRAGEALLGCAKARHEHQLVVDDIVAALGPHCRDLRVPVRPQLLTLPSVQHLWSPITATVSAGTSVLRIIEALHPTSAVGGVPRRAARDWLTRHAPQARGWYTGALGWVSPGGRAELSVALRCALLRGREADLYAGAGIVADSDPAAELAETEWKLQTMIDALAAA